MGAHVYHAPHLLRTALADKKPEQARAYLHWPHIGLAAFFSLLRLQHEPHL